MVVSPKTKDTDLISIIIPTYCEEELLPLALEAINKAAKRHTIEVVVVDGGSTDNTLQIAEKYGAVTGISGKKGRANQMNQGAKMAKGNILFFLHSDAQVSDNFDVHIAESLNQFDFGYFGYQFLSAKVLLKWVARFNKSRSFFAGGGDQGLFIKKELFQAVGGFNNEWEIMEDFELKDRLLSQGFNYTIVQEVELKVSARKYLLNSFVRVWLANAVAFGLYKLGAKPSSISMFYTRALKS